MHEQGSLYGELDEPGGQDQPTRAAGTAPEGDVQADADDLTFEQAFVRLERIVEQLEGGDAALDDSLRLFEEGVRLARFCRTRLARAEKRIRVLIDGKEGAEEERIAAGLEREISGGDGDVIG